MSPLREKYSSNDKPNSKVPLTYWFSVFKGVTEIGINVTITIDNSGSLVIDTGENRNVVCEWQKAEHFTLRGDTKVVTIKAHNDKGLQDVGGILASFSNNVVTDESWNCTDMIMCPRENSDCEGLANWQPAKTYGHNNKKISPWSEISKIKQTAQWIWVENKVAKRVWCRKTFGE